jgi:hypothetical protein
MKRYDLFSKLLNKEIMFQTHASQRSFEREISSDEIVKIIDDVKTHVIIQKNGRIKFENHEHTIIAELKNGILWIITVFEN